MTKDDFEILKQYESHFKTAQVGYIRGLLRKDADVLIEVGSHYNIRVTNRACSSCILDLCKRLGNLYFEYKQSIITPTNIKTKTKNTRK